MWGIALKQHFPTRGPSLNHNRAYSHVFYPLPLPGGKGAYCQNGMSVVEKTGQPVLRHLKSIRYCSFRKSGSFDFPIAARISSMALFQKFYNKAQSGTRGFKPLVCVSYEFFK